MTEIIREMVDFTHYLAVKMKMPVDNLELFSDCQLSRGTVDKPCWSCDIAKL